MKNEVCKIAVILVAFWTLLMVGSPASANQSSKHSATVTPSEPRVHELSREEQVRALYETVARNLRAAGHELTLDIQAVTTIPREKFALYRTHQVFTVGEGVALRIKPHTSSTDVEMPDGSRREIDSFITFQLEWQPDYWLMESDSVRSEMFRQIRRKTFADYIEDGSNEDEALRDVVAATTAEIQLEYKGRQRRYRSVALWYEEGFAERTFLVMDRILLQLESALALERPVRPVSALDEVAEIPTDFREEISERRSADTGLDHSEMKCNASYQSATDSSFKSGTEEHSGSGEHQSSADIQFACTCDTACVSNCSASFTFTNCADFEPIAVGRKHVAATSQDTKNGTKFDAVIDQGASCVGGFGCVFRSCSVGTSCGVSVSVKIGSDLSVKFESSNVTHALNSAFEVQGGCPKCEVDTTCVGLGSENACGSDPEPLPEEDMCITYPELCTPIVIDIARDGFRFTGFDSWVAFDINADGTPERITWTDPAAEEAFLVLDRNGNGRIDDGAELFGAVTEQPGSDERNGFKALAVFDQSSKGGNGDGVITAADAVFESLLLWKDSNQDATSQASELRKLADADIHALQLSYVTSKRRDRHGNTLRWTSFVQFTDRSHLAAADVIFVPVPEGVD